MFYQVDFIICNCIINRIKCHILYTVPYVLGKVVLLITFVVMPSLSPLDHNSELARPGHGSPYSDCGASFRRRGRKNEVKITS